MKNLRNKIVLSGLVLLFALVATIGSTFAWFTVSNTVTVGAMELNVKSSESLLIRVYNGETGLLANQGDEDLLDATTYKANLTQADILAAATAGYDDLATFRLAPVTMTTTQTSGLLSPKAPFTMDVDNKTYAALNLTTGVNAETGYVIDIKFWVMTQGTEGEIVLEDLVITSDADNLDAQDAVVNAVKLAVWNGLEYNDGVPADPSETAVTYGLDKDYAFAFTAGMRGFTDGKYYWVGAAGSTNLRNIAGTTVYTYVPGDLAGTTPEETGYWTKGAVNYILDGGVLEVANIDHTGATEVASANIFTTAAFANDAALNRIDDTDQAALALLQGTYYKLGATPLANVVTATKTLATTITTLEQNEPTLLTVRIYVEGWDAQATNAILAAVFAISFKFSLRDVA